MTTLFCPFCGSTSHTLINPLKENTRCWVQCSHCAAEGPMGTTEREAVDRWNMRATVPNSEINSKENDQ